MTAAALADAGFEKARRQLAATPPGTAAVRSFFDPATGSVSHVVHDPATARAAIVDSVLGFDPASGRTSTAPAQVLLDHVRDHGLTVDWLLETHAHADHFSAAPWLQEQTGAPIAIGEHIVDVQRAFAPVFNAGPEFRCDGSAFDRLWRDGEGLMIGALPVTVLHVPGHTPACVAYVVGDVVFVGDTMFMPDFGSARTDFPGGDARTLFRSLRRILALPGATRLFLCHDYLTADRTVHAWETTVAEQRRANAHVHDGVSEDEFVALRERRDAGLDMPRLLLPAIQVNMRAGRLPPPENDGVSYLKIPINVL